MGLGYWSNSFSSVGGRSITVIVDWSYQPLFWISSTKFFKEFSLIGRIFAKAVQFTGIHWEYANVNSARVPCTFLVRALNSWLFSFFVFFFTMVRRFLTFYVRHCGNRRWGPDYIYLSSKTNLIYGISISQSCVMESKMSVDFIKSQSPVMKPEIEVK